MEDSGVSSPCESQNREKTGKDVAEELLVDNKPSEDVELDDILEDALQDFDKQAVPFSSSLPSVDGTHCISTNITHDQPCKTTLGHSEPAAAASSNSYAAAGSSCKPPTAPMPDMKGMESLIMSLMSGDTSLLTQQLEGLDFGLDSTDISEAGSGTDFAETLQRTLGDLAQSTQDLQHDNLSEEELMRLVSSLGADGIDGLAENAGGGGDDELMPMMHGMMKSLLSKDILYPSLKEISTQYPAWLELHRDKISHEDFDRYDRQYRLMASIVQEFEAEKPTDEDDVKRHRFERVLEIMQQMQALGQPPKELVGEMPRGLDLDEDGLPKLPTGLPSPDQCVVM